VRQQGRKGPDRSFPPRALDDTVVPHADRPPVDGGSFADQPDRILELALPADPASAGAARRALAGYCAANEVPPEVLESGGW
jgi:hypothetical protein